MLHPRHNRAAYLSDKAVRLTEERDIQLSHGYQRRARILSEQISSIASELAQLEPAAA